VPRASLFLIVPIIVVVAAVTAVQVGRSATNPAPAAAPTLRGTEVFTPGVHRAPAFRLRNQDGRVVTLASLRGAITAITFLDPTCTLECPVTGAELARTQRLLGPHASLTVVMISVAPRHDAPANLRAFVRKSHLSRPWEWLIGSRAQLAPVWREYGIAVQNTSTDVVHTDAVYLVDRRGWIQVADAVPFQPSQLAGSVEALAAM
jgi:protein SCO1/2